MSTVCTFYDLTTTAITSVRELSDETLWHYLEAGAVMLRGARGDPALHYVVGEDLVEYTAEERAALAALAPGWVWQMPERVAVDQRELVAAKALKNQEINQKRLAANRTSFLFAGKAIACDELSMIDIQALNGMVLLLNGLPAGFNNQWKAMDNTYVAIPDKATWTAFYGAMVATGQANFDRSQSLKSSLATATTNAEIDAITWEN